MPILSVICDTYLKARPVPLTELLDSEKRYLQAKDIFTVSSYSEDNEHYSIFTLGLKKWFVCKKHVKLTETAVMSQSNFLELAQQGDPQAIAALMNQSLPRGMTATVERMGDHLSVLIEADQVPNRQTLMAFVHQGISDLGIESIRLVKVLGQQTGTNLPVWTQDLTLELPTTAAEAIDAVDYLSPLADFSADVSLTDDSGELEALWIAPFDEQSQDPLADLLAEEPTDDLQGLFNDQTEEFEAGIGVDNPLEDPDINMFSGLWRGDLDSSADFANGAAFAATALANPSGDRPATFEERFPDLFDKSAAEFEVGVDVDRKTEDLRSRFSESTAQEELKQFTLGRILFDTPHRMKVGTPYTVSVRITKNLTQDFSKGLTYTQKIEIEKVRVSRFMTVSLSGDGFRTKPLHKHCKQVIEEEDFTQWKWEVMPLKGGKRQLFVYVTIHIEVDNVHGSKDLEALKKEIDITINPVYSVKHLASQSWGWTIAAAPVIAIVVAILQILSSKK